METTIYLPTKEPLCKLTVSTVAELPAKLHELHVSKPLPLGSYVESGGSTWTLVGLDPFEFQPPFMQASLAQAVTPQQAPPPPSKIQGYLAYLEANSSCKGFRGSIQATFWLNLLIWMGIGLWGTCNFINSRIKYDPSAARDAYEARFLYEMGVAFLVVNALIVLRQLALLLTNYLDSRVVGRWELWRREQPAKE